MPTEQILDEGEQYNCKKHEEKVHKYESRKLSFDVEAGFFKHGERKKHTNSSPARPFRVSEAATTRYSDSVVMTSNYRKYIDDTNSK